jgi:hypothetical protein
MRPRPGSTTGTIAACGGASPLANKKGNPLGLVPPPTRPLLRRLAHPRHRSAAASAWWASMPRPLMPPGSALAELCVCADGRAPVASPPRRKLLPTVVVSIEVRVVYVGSSDGAITLAGAVWAEPRNGGALRGHKVVVLCLAVVGRTLTAARTRTRGPPRSLRGMWPPDRTKVRRVSRHHDAVKVAVTATPIWRRCCGPAGQFHHCHSTIRTKN